MTAPDRVTPVKIIVSVGDDPWTGVAYTTKAGARRPYRGPGELARAISTLANWPELRWADSDSEPDGTAPVIGLGRGAEAAASTTRTDLAAERAAAAVEETAAAIGAVLSLDELRGAPRAALVDLQGALDALSVTLGDTSGPVDCLHRACDAVGDVLTRHPASTSAGTLGPTVTGHSTAAALLLMARATARRAAATVAELDAGPTREAARDCLLALRPTLEAIARDTSPSSI